MAKVKSQVDYKFIIELNDKEALALYRVLKVHDNGTCGDNCLLYDALYIELKEHNLI